MKNQISLDNENNQLMIKGFALNIPNINNIKDWMFSIYGYYFRCDLKHVHGNKYYIEIAQFQTKGDSLKNDNAIDFIWLDYFNNN